MADTGLTGVTEQLDQKQQLLCDEMVRTEHLYVTFCDLSAHALVSGGRQLKSLLEQSGST